MKNIFDKFDLILAKVSTHPGYGETKTVGIVGTSSEAVILSPIGYQLGCYKEGEKPGGLGLSIIAMDTNHTVGVSIMEKKKILQLRDFLNEFIETYEDDMIV